MDPRKQKRLGPAPIASFEKSFEDNTSSHCASVNTISGLRALGNGSNAIEDMKENNSVGREIMDSHNNAGNGNGVDTVDEPNGTMTSPNRDKDTHRHHQQHHHSPQPSISLSQPGSKKLYEIGGKRPPPLKMASTINTTLISSGPLTPLKSVTLHTPSTPRIELSRASSSSHQEEDSRESSPENVFEQVGTGTLQETIGLGFREEGALELRSSTEELFFMDPEQKKEEQEKFQQQQQARRSSPQIFRFDDHQSYLQQHQRKDSASSEVAALLCISGRTSRISSVGSQGSAVSRLSAVSGVSRSPSPHRMLLETSFCGPKPLENIVDGRVVSTVEPPTAEVLEQVLLSRKHDPTKAVLAEGIKIESSPKKMVKATKVEVLSNGEASSKAGLDTTDDSKQPVVGATSKATMGRSRASTKSPGQMVIGKTPSGTEYIRINLKPNHMYNDKGIAPNERVVEAPNSLTPVTSKSSHKKPISLSLGRNMPTIDANRLTPISSPKPSRHIALTKEIFGGSRSPSPKNVSVSRKSSFNALFKTKDSPDSPRERSRSRSKSKEHISTTPQSQSATPNKQKSVLAIFKPKRGSCGTATGAAAAAESKSKSSSPIDSADHPIRSKSNTPQDSSRPGSRLRYYDTPTDGKGIHIPLHTPPEDKETRKFAHGIEKLSSEPMVRPQSAPITVSQLAAAAAALKPISGSPRAIGATSVNIPRSQLVEKIQYIENLDAIHTLANENGDDKERSWSLEVQRHSSQDSQETIGSEGSIPNNSKVSARTSLANVSENPVRENGIAAAAEIHRSPLAHCDADRTEENGRLPLQTKVAHQPAPPPQSENAIAREKRRILFATRIGSGSQEQIFSTQFSLSKTESLSSQLSEQMSIPESPAQEQLQRQDTVLRRPDDLAARSAEICSETKPQAPPPPPLKRLSSIEGNTNRPKSATTSEDEKIQPVTVLMRKKDSLEESRRKSRSTSEDDDIITTANHRHSRYLENFDVRKKFHENVTRKVHSSLAAAKENERLSKLAQEPQSDTATVLAQPFKNGTPILPQSPLPSLSPSPPPPMSSGRLIQHQEPSLKIQQQQTVPVQSHTKPAKPPRTSVSASPLRQPASSSASSPHPPSQLDRQSVLSTDDPIESSESERDSDLASVGSGDPKRRHLPRHVGIIEDHESTGLVSQDSFDDELPYIPTSLPEERAHGVALIPMKERAHMELKMCPLDRPRSTTPLNPSHLEEYCSGIAAVPEHPTDHPDHTGTGLIRGEKLRISLPRKDSIKEKAQKSKSPRRASNASGKSWFEFAEEGLRGAPAQGQAVPNATVAITDEATASGPSLPPARKTSEQWIDFENIPERRRAPKRITTLPKDGQPQTPHQYHYQQTHSQPDITASTGTDEGKPHYNYVKPEDCQCECHEVERESSGAATHTTLASVDLLQQGEDMQPLLDPDTHDGIDPSDSSREYSCYTDDEMDVPIGRGRSSHSSAGDQLKNDEFPLRDGVRSPRNKRFPDKRYS